MTQRFDWLLFDADGTILDYDAAELHSLHVAADSFGVGVTEEILAAYREINSALWRQFELGEVSSGNLRVRRFDRLASRFGWEIPGTDFSDAYLSALADAGHIMPGARDMLDALPDFYRLAIVTNGIREVQYGRLGAAGLLDRFEHIIISEDAGAAKPDSAFFEYANQVLGEPQKDRLVIIGDSLSSDIAGGVGYDIPTVWFNPEGRPNQSDIQPDWEIRDWDGLQSILFGEI